MKLLLVWKLAKMMLMWTEKRKTIYIKDRKTKARWWWLVIRLWGQCRSWAR